MVALLFEGKVITFLEFLGMHSLSDSIHLLEDTVLKTEVAILLLSLLYLLHALIDPHI